MGSNCTHKRYAQRYCFGRSTGFVRELPGATGLLRIDEFFDGLLKLGYDGPVYAEPFYAPLKEMPYDEAVKVVTDAINKVWPL